MSNNPNGEYQIPSGEHSLVPEVSIRDEINVIYQTQQQNAEDVILDFNESRIEICEVSRKLYTISISIKEAREDYLRAA